MMRQFINIVESVGGYTEVEFVCINPAMGGSDPKNVAALYRMLSQQPGLVLMRQDFMEEFGHLAFVAIIVDSTMVDESDIAKAANKAGVEIDSTRQIGDSILDRIYDGSYPDMIDMLDTSDGTATRGVSWGDHHSININETI